jgi:hypothetical protein
MQKRALILIGCFLLLVFAVPAAAAEPVGLSILYPSDTNAVIAPGRDFYVIGKITGLIPERGLLTVTLTRVGETSPVRTVYSNLKNDTEGILTTHPDLLGSSDPEVISKSQMPDLVYDPVNLDSIRDVWRKCTYDDHNFSALISGGRYRSDLRIVDEKSKTLYPLESGVYDVVVTLRYRSRTLAQVSKRISLGVAPSKAVARLFPPEHVFAVQTDAKARGIQFLTDPMPGYWAPQFLDAHAGSSLFLEIPARWHQALRAEYARGLSHLYLYNIAQNSAVQTVVLGLLQQQGVVESFDRLRFYYYDIGEPQLSYLPERSSRLIAVPEGVRMVLTRAEITAGDYTDNLYDPNAAFEGTIDFNLSNGVTVEAGQNLSIFGVVTPIQNSPGELTETADHRVETPNRIASVFYSVTGGGTAHYFDHPVALTRQFDDREVTSIYEFKHTIPIRETMAGRKLLVTLEGVDTRGEIIASAQQSFSLTVIPAASQTDSRPSSALPEEPPVQEPEIENPEPARINPPTGASV